MDWTSANDGTSSQGRSKRAGTRRRYQDDAISDDEIDGKRTFDLEEKLHSSRFSSDRVKRMEGKDFTYEYVQRGGLRDPIIFERPDGLGMKMPDPDFGVNDVKTFVGSRRLIDVMDVSTQKGTEMSMAQWCRYYETPASQRDKLYNVISLEFSHTKLESLVKRPATVEMIDWVDNMWPRHLKERQRDSTNSIMEMQYPKVQKYCLMSVQGCFTDFHVDFGGTSVWYHILNGSKVFWLIPPTPPNLEMYENWVLSGKQGDLFLGDRATDCQRIELKQGYTFIIPSGWIHAVYTPVDTLVFGGNFLHSFNVPMQLNVASIEDRTRVPAKFRCPFFFEMAWYVLERYLYSLTNTSYLIPEYQKYSLGIGYKQESLGCEVTNGHTKEEQDESNDPPSGPGVKVHLTPFELEGLWNLVGKLEALPAHKKYVPSGIHNAAALLHDIRALLKEHAHDSSKLSYTGKPIVRWPKRPSWYQPPPPPPPVIRPKLATTPIVPRPVKPSSNMSVLRRRRVRCKRCEACMRTECGDCNFCRDMKKFGGPGKLKQTCVLRQCLAPGLPLSAVCEICGEGSLDVGEELMECSNCAQIAHPSCLKVSGDGVINKDLPSCWECPKCVLGKDTESESSGSGDDITAQDGSGGLRGEGGAWHRVGRPPSSLSHGSLQKQAAAPEQRLRKRINVEGVKTHKRKSSSLDPRVAKIYRRHGMEHDDDSASDDEEGDGGRKMSIHSRGGVSSSRRGYGTGRRGVWRGTTHRGNRGGGSLTSSLKMRRGLGARGERGGRVRLRGGSHMRRRRYETDDDDDDDDDDEDDDDDDEDEEDDDEDDSDEERHLGRSEKEHRSRRRRRRGEDDDEDEDDDSEEQDFDGEDDEMEDMDDGGDDDDDDGENQSDSDTDPPILLVSDLNDDLLNDSYLTVTLQRPPKAKRDPGSIVPKLEAAMSPRTPNAPGFIQRKTLPRARLRNSNLTPTGNGLSQSKGANASSRHNTRRNSNQDGRERDTLSPSSVSSRSSVSPPPPPPSITMSSPPSLLSHPSFRDVGNERGCEKDIWVSVFRYLSRTDLAVCMRVCKAWYKWCCDKRLWTRIDLSRCRSLSPQAISAIIKRQPVTLDLSWTPVSKKQIAWLIHHLPGLKDLVMSGCSSLCVSALSSQSCPGLRTLDLCWAVAVKDTHIKDLIVQPGSESRSRLRGLLNLRLSGLDISDSLLKLIVRHMPSLRRLDLSHCQGLTDQSVNLITASGCNTRNTLRQLNLAGCNKLTDACLSYMKRLSALRLLDLRGCKNVTRRGCENFISDLSYCTVFCLTEDKLIQKIS